MDGWIEQKKIAFFVNVVSLSCMLTILCLILHLTLNVPNFLLLFLFYLWTRSLILDP